MGIEPTGPDVNRGATALKAVGKDSQSVVGQSLANSTPSHCQAHCQELAQNDTDLAIVIDSWNRLPEAVRAGIVAMVKATQNV